MITMSSDKDQGKNLPSHLLSHSVNEPLHVTKLRLALSYEGSFTLSEHESEFFVRSMSLLSANLWV